MVRDQVEIVYPNGQVRFFDLDPAVGILNIGRHADNDIVLSDAGVRLFHALLDYRQRPYQLIQLDEQGVGTQLQEINHWQTVRIGDHELVLVDRTGGDNAPIPIANLTRGGAQAPPATPPSQRDQEGRTGGASGSPSPLLPPDQRAPELHPAGGESRWQVTPGQSLVHTLTILNSGGRAADFSVDVQGLDPDWLVLSPQQVHLRPGEEADVQVAITPTPGAQHGTYPFTWQIVSPQYPGWQQAETVALSVGSGRPHIVWGELQPALVRSRRFRHAGHAILSLTNAGDQAVDYQLWGKDLRGDCRIHFRPVQEKPGRNRAETKGTDSSRILHLPAGETVVVHVVVAPLEGRLTGVRTHRFRFVVQGGFPGSSQMDQSTTGTFEGRPVINVGILLVIALLALLAAIFIYRDKWVEWVDDLRSAPVAAQSIDPTPTAVPFSSQFTPSQLSANGTGGKPFTGQAGNMSYETIFKEIGQQYNVDWRLLAALAYRESRLDAGATGGAGEYGLMQIMPATWAEWAPLVAAEDPWDPYSNVLVGTAYFSYIHAYFSDLGHRDQRWALAAYNWGPERVLQILDRRGNWQEIPLPQRQYVADVLMYIDNAPGWVQAVDRMQNP